MFSSILWVSSARFPKIHNAANYATDIPRKGRSTIFLWQSSRDNNNLALSESKHLTWGWRRKRCHQLRPGTTSWNTLHFIPVILLWAKLIRAVPWNLFAECGKDNFLALWPQRPSSRSKWRRPTTNPRRSVCCCGNARPYRSHKSDKATLSLHVKRFSNRLLFKISSDWSWNKC